MTTQDEDALFEDILALSNEAEDMGLSDVALVLEFALDVFLKETGKDDVTPADAPLVLERSARKFDTRIASETNPLPRIGWSMDTFPLAQMNKKAS